MQSWPDRSAGPVKKIRRPIDRYRFLAIACQVSQSFKALLNASAHVRPEVLVGRWFRLPVDNSATAGSGDLIP